MLFFNFRMLSKSFKYALRGIRYLIKEERSFKVHILAILIVVGLSFYFKIKWQDAVILIFAITLVLIAELINTSFEKVVDILKPRIHYYAEVIKDIMAAAVLIASVAALAIGILIFFSYIFNK